MQASRLSSIALAVSGVGLALHLYTVIFKAGGELSFFLVALFLWSCAPYAVGAGLSWFVRTQVIAFGAVSACLVADAFMHYSVFIAPKSSTAALGLIFMPLWNLVAVGPLGALLAWAVLRMRGSRANAL
ncbi:hypothetical protein [Noviherbaspirillum sp.]|uniref:hypothetical protein n=1 Tax=Noviherbaspirillum sp. TaxID=1926288 RepID=UPI002FE16B4D